MVGALKVTMNVFVFFFLLPESSLTVMLLMSETPWGFNSVTVSSLSESTSGAHLMTPWPVLSPVRAGCEWAASQVVQLVDYPTLETGQQKKLPGESCHF